MKPYQVACFGEVLWDILPDQKLPGGAPMNVAYHLQKLGVHVAMISATGNDADGDNLRQVMQQLQLDTTFVQKDPVHETGKVYARLAATNEMQYEIVQPVAWDFILPSAALQEIANTPGYLVFGSLASRNEVSKSTLFSLLEGGRTLVLDINLRPPHFSQELVELLLQHCQILKINEAELELIGNWYQLPANMEERVRALSQNYNIPTIIVTLGDKGAALLMENTFYQHPGYQVTVADTIGSGDAFLAGFLYNRIINTPPAVTLAYACALGALIASYPGGCPEYNPDEIIALINR
ncbi:carbohydrate kinase [Chitinophaga sp.]|uniref:carbohydrate kinase family protein n=1 Tax=Chitinophaga sp. TaxID=1869181 RepID=UPI0031CDB795